METQRKMVGSFQSDLMAISQRFTLKVGLSQVSLLFQPQFSKLISFKWKFGFEILT